MPTYRLEDEQGQWLTDTRLDGFNWKPGDVIYRGRDALEVVDVRPHGDKTALVVVPVSKSH